MFHAICIFSSWAIAFSLLAHVHFFMRCFLFFLATWFLTDLDIDVGGVRSKQ